MHLLRFVQEGVVSRRQLHRLDYRPHDIERMLRRRELARVHPGVYVDHTGPPSWEQRAWAAVLVHEPAALTRRSALPAPPERAPSATSTSPCCASAARSGWGTRRCSATRAGPRLR